MCISRNLCFTFNWIVVHYQKKSIHNKKLGCYWFILLFNNFLITDIGPGYFSTLNQNLRFDILTFVTNNTALSWELTTCCLELTLLCALPSTRIHGVTVQQTAVFTVLSPYKYYYLFLNESTDRLRLQCQLLVTEIPASMWHQLPYESINFSLHECQTYIT